MKKAPRYFNQSIDRLIETHKPMLIWIAKKHETRAFPVFNTVENYFKYCVRYRRKFTLDNGLNYFKNATAIIKEISIKSKNVKYLGVKKGCKHYKFNKKFIEGLTCK